MLQGVVLCDNVYKWEMLSLVVSKNKPLHPAVNKWSSLLMFMDTVDINGKIHVLFYLKGVHQTQFDLILGGIYHADVILFSPVRSVNRS